MLGDDKTKRKKETRREREEEAPVPLADAFAELKPNAFSVWMRLHVEDRETLMLGRQATARALGYTVRAFNMILFDLDAAGYISFSPGPRNTTQIRIRRRCKLPMKGFVRVGRVLPSRSGNSAVPLLGTTVPLLGTTVPCLGTSVPLLGTTVPCLGINSRSDLEISKKMGRRNLQNSRGLLKLGNGTGFNSSKPKERTSIEMVSQKSSNSSKKAAGRNPSSLIEHRKKDLALRRAVRSTARLARAKRREAQGLEEGQVNWDRLPEFIRGASPRSRRWKLYARTISEMDHRSKQYRKIRDLVREDLEAIYVEYRAQLSSVVAIRDSDRKKLAELGCRLLVAEITPRELLEYWHTEVGKFTSLKCPTIAFLCGTNAVDAIVAMKLGGGGGETASELARKGPSAKRTARPRRGNSYETTDGLDRGLRGALEEEGFPTRAYSDTYLLSVQHNALMIVAERDIFLAPGPFREMVLWAAEHYFEGDE